MTRRIVVLISGTGSNMTALVDACRRGDVPAEVVAVVADRPCEGLQKAEDKGVQTELVVPSAFGSRDEWSTALAGVVERFEPDLVVSAGFMRILAPVFVDRFEGRLINLHPSLLPDFPGAHAVRDALAAGVPMTGTTVHYVDHGVDTGRIIVQCPVPIRPDDDEDTLHERIKQVERRMLREACWKIFWNQDRGLPT